MGRRKWSDEAVLEALRGVVAERGENVGLVEFIRASGISEKAIALRFGSWLGLRRAAGLAAGQRKRQPVYARETLIARLRELVRERGAGITLDEFCRASGISHPVVYARCGSWAGLWQAAGLTPAPRRRASRHTREGLRDSLMRLAAERGGRVTQAEFARETGIACGTIRRFWGSWSALQQAVDLKPNRRRSRWSDEDLLREFQRVVQLLDKVPTIAEIDRYARCGSLLFYKRFGNMPELKQRFARFLMAQKLGTDRPLSTEDMVRLMGTVPESRRSGSA